MNYKDGLAVTGKSPVVRRFPMIAGIDFAGTVETSSHPALETRRQGDPQRLGLRRDPSRRLCGKGARQGRLAGAVAGQHERARSHGDRHRRLYRHAVGDGAGAGRASRRRAAPVIVTGAAGGVGSVAVALLAKLGYTVIASTGRPAEAAYLKELGAAEVIERKELAGPPRALGKERWAGGIDAVGSTTLANVLSMTRYGGAVAACGLAGGMDLPTTVAPFILRGVSLLGIDSVMCPMPLRQQAWRRLETDLDRSKIAAMTSEIGLADVIDAGPRILAGAGARAHCGKNSVSGSEFRQESCPACGALW